MNYAKRRIRSFLNSSTSSGINLTIDFENENATFAKSGGRGQIQVMSYK